jgi:hypothetical protein
MNGYRWTVRVGLGGAGILVMAAALVVVLRIFNVVIAGVQPEAWVLAAMMTAPFTIGLVLVLTAGTALVETLMRRRNSVRS